MPLPQHPFGRRPEPQPCARARAAIVRTRPSKAGARGQPMQAPVANESVEAPRLALVCDIRVDVGEPITIGATAAGLRRVVPILGGRVDGPRLSGRVIAGGADFQIL